MKITKSIWVALVSVTVCFSQSYNISGIVTDTGTTPISGAVVRLEQAGLTAVSGADGRFTLSGTAGIARRGGAASNRPAVSLRGGLINLELPEPTVVRVQVYSVQGRLISMVERTVGAGTQSMIVPQVGTGVLLYGVNIGSQEVFLRGNAIGNTKTFDVKRVTSDGNQTERQASAVVKTMAGQENMAAVVINDVIAATKTGYLNYRCVQYTSDTAGEVIKMIASAGTVSDTDGNVYQTVRIGNQVWMAENLRVTKYNDGSAIPHVTDSAAWHRIYTNNQTTPAYCYYNNTTNSDSIKKFGALYNWYTVNTGKLAAAGWHVPTDSEWTIMENYLVRNGYNWDGTTDTLQYNKIAKALAAKTDCLRYSTSPTGTIGCDLTLNNRSGFSALLGGFRSHDHGTFWSQSLFGIWWSASEGDASDAYGRPLGYDKDYLYRINFGKSCGFSVRLVKD